MSYFELRHMQARQLAAQAVYEAPADYIVTIKEPTRNLDQNAAQWPILQAFSEQLQWPVNGQMVWMTDGEWKDVLTCAFEQESPRLAMGMNGGVVMLGKRTSKMGKKRFSEWLDFLHATAALKGVVVYREAVTS